MKAQISVGKGKRKQHKELEMSVRANTYVKKWTIQIKMKGKHFQGCETQINLLLQKNKITLK